MYTFKVKLTYPVGPRYKTEVITTEAPHQAKAMENAFFKIVTTYSRPHLNLDEIEFNNVEAVSDIYSSGTTVRFTEAVVDDPWTALLIAKYGREDVYKTLVGRTASVVKFSVDPTHGEYCHLSILGGPKPLEFVLSTKSLEVINV